MRYQSAKRRKLMAENKAARQDFLAEQLRCAVCGSARSLTCHEMAKGCHRNEALSNRLAWLCACWICNSGPLNDYEQWPLARQLSRKQDMDPEHYDLVGFNRLRGREDGAITQDEVDEWR